MKQFPRKALLIVTLPFMVACAQAQVFKCTDATGKTAFTDQPCAPAQQSSRLKLPAVPPVAAPVPATGQAMSPAAAAHEQLRQQKRAESNAIHQRIDDASNKVHKIRAENADPKKCAEAKRRMAAMESAGRDTLLLVKADPDYFHYQQLASLHCGN